MAELKENTTPKGRLFSQRESSSSPDEPTPKRRVSFKDIDDLNVPDNTATLSDWGKFLLEQIKTVNENIKSVAQTADYASDQATLALSEILAMKSKLSTVKKKISV